MKLDDRIIDRKYIFDCLTSDKAKKFLGKKGYFAGNLYCFTDVQQFCPYGTLADVFEDSEKTFQRGEILYPYFIPECYLKPKDYPTPKEKKFRPYTLKEFLNEFPMFTTITMREKEDKDCIITCTFICYRTRIICTDICLGVEYISLGTLADEYEYQYMFSEIWKPFGVKE